MGGSGRKCSRMTCWTFSGGARWSRLSNWRGWLHAPRRGLERGQGRRLRPDGKLQGPTPLTFRMLSRAPPDTGRRYALRAAWVALRVHAQPLGHQLRPNRGGTAGFRVRQLDFVRNPVPLGNVSWEWAASWNRALPAAAQPGRLRPDARPGQLRSGLDTSARAVAGHRRLLDARGPGPDPRSVRSTPLRGMGAGAGCEGKVGLAAVRFGRSCTDAWDGLPLEVRDARSAFSVSRGLVDRSSRRDGCRPQPCADGVAKGRSRQSVFRGCRSMDRRSARLPAYRSALLGGLV